MYFAMASNVSVFLCFLVLTVSILCIKLMRVDCICVVNEI